MYGSETVLLRLRLPRAGPRGTARSLHGPPSLLVLWSFFVRGVAGRVRRVGMQGGAYVRWQRPPFEPRAAVRAGRGVL